MRPIREIQGRSGVTADLRKGNEKDLCHIEQQPSKKEDSYQAASHETKARHSSLLHTCHLLGREVQGFNSNI